MNAIIVATPASAMSVSVGDLTERANEYAVASHGKGTRRTYESGWAHYVSWCDKIGRKPLSGDPTVIALYVTACAGYGHTVDTITVRLAAIRKAHRMAAVPLDLADPALVLVREGIARTHGTRAKRKAAPATPDVLRPMVASRQPHTVPAGARDRAMLLIGFGAALRRSELVALQIGDIEHVHGRGLRVLIQRSKTDKHGAGQTVSVAANPSDPDLCPAVAFERWMEHRRQADDGATLDRALFCGVDPQRRMTGDGLSDQIVQVLVKASSKAAGYDPKLFSGHSLRRGFATSAARGGASLPELMRHTRHKSPTEALGYIDQANEWNRNASEMAWGAAS